MKKVILSFGVVIIFAAYALFVKSGAGFAQLYKATPVAVNPTTTTTNAAGQVTKNSDCVYIPYQDSETNEGGFNDNESGEVKTQNGYYKCTTITVATPPTTTPAPVITPTPTPKPTPAPVVATPPPVVKPKSTAIWNDGTFIGDSTDAYYGNVQVSATISGGRLTSITFLDYPQDRQTSLQKSNHAMPILKSEAISAQSANVNTVSGATYTSEAFISSLSSALAQAKM